MNKKEQKRNKTRFLVLLALAHGSKHGYEISKFIDEKTRGFFALPFGSLYPVLHQLEKEQFISSEWIDPTSHKPKKCYSLTKSGTATLDDEIQNFRSSTKAITELIPAGA